MTFSLSHYLSYAAICMLACSACSACKTSKQNQEPTVNEQNAAEPGTNSGDPEPTALTTVNDFFAGGPPTFVLGTLGDERSDRNVATQVRLIRGVLNHSNEIADVAVQAKDPSTWPPRPILYGGAHVNSLLAALSETLPLQVSANRLHIADKKLEGPGYQLITVVPKQDSHPQFLLFAGTGTPGVAEINAIQSGSSSILIADDFGTLYSGAWATDSSGGLKATLGPPSRRIDWRRVEGKTATLALVAKLPARSDEAELIKDCEAGVATVIRKLEIATPKPITIYLSPDSRSKVSLTGKGGDGHALPEFQVLHVVALADGVLRGLITHEATHLLTHAAFGQAATALLGEGIAVWVTGQYATIPIDQFAKHLDGAMKVTDLLGAKFRELPEKEAYMHGGLLVEAAVELVGIAKVGEFLLGAGSENWDEACQAAGTSAQALQAAYAARVAKRP